MVDEKRYNEVQPDTPMSAGHRLDLAVGRLHETIVELEKAISPILTQDYPSADVTSIDDPGTLLHATASRLEGQATWLRDIIGRVEL